MRSLDFSGAVGLSRCAGFSGPCYCILSHFALLTLRFFREMDELIVRTSLVWNRWLFSFQCRFSLHLHPRACVTATGGINIVRLCLVEICPLVNIGFFPRSQEYEYPISLRGRPRDNTDGESATSLKQEYVPNSGIFTFASVFDSTKSYNHMLSENKRPPGTRASLGACTVSKNTEPSFCSYWSSTF